MKQMMPCSVELLPEETSSPEEGGDPQAQRSGEESLKAIMRDGVDYEFTIVMDLNLKHHAVASKDRTNLFMGRPEFIITPETGNTILRWCNSEVNNNQSNQNYGSNDFTSGRTYQSMS